MNKQQWKAIIKEQYLVDLNWSDDEWERWQSGDLNRLTRDQKAMVAACKELDKEPFAGELSPNTISFH